MNIKTRVILFILVVFHYSNMYSQVVKFIKNPVTAKYTSESTMNRVAQVKAQSQASTFLNGATISMDMVITTKESKDSTNNVKTIVETVEQIKQSSVGFSQGLELLSNFDNADSLRMIFIYIRELKKE